MSPLPKIQEAVVQTVRTPDKQEILGNPKLLRDATYLLFSLPDLKPETVHDELHRFFSDRINNRNSEEWEAKIAPIRAEHKERYAKWHQEALAQQHQRLEKEGLLGKEHLPLEEIYVVHCTDYPPKEKDGYLTITSTYKAIDRAYPRTTIHFSLNHPVAPVQGAMLRSHDWGEKKYVVIAPLKGMIALNGNPYGLVSTDTWWGTGDKAEAMLPEGTIIVTKPETAKAIPHTVGTEIAEVSGSPVAETPNVLRSRSIKYIPGKIPGEAKLADELGAFYGLHGQSMGLSAEGSESYLYSEMTLYGNAYNHEVVADSLKVINNPTSTSEQRYSVLVDMVRTGYFYPPGCYGFKINVSGENRNDLVSALRGQNGGFLQGIADIYRPILQNAANNPNLNLPYYSEGFLKNHLDEVRKTFSRIPPNLIGIFTSLHYEHLGLDKTTIILIPQLP